MIIMPTGRNYCSLALIVILTSLFCLRSAAAASPGLDLLVADYETQRPVSTVTKLLDDSISRVTRLYVYYSKQDQNQQTVTIRISNAGPPVTVKVWSGTGNASDDTSAVAAKATGCFWMARWFDHRVKTHTIGTGEYYDIVNAPIDKGLVTYNGIFQIDPQSSSANLRAFVLVSPKGLDLSNVDISSMQTVAQDSGRRKPGRYDISNLQTENAALSLTSLVSVPASLEIGSDGWGDYGMAHTYHFSISNPSTQRRSASLYIDLRGGSAQGTFIIKRGLQATMLQTVLLCGADRAVTQCVPRSGPTRYRLLSYNLQPGQSIGLDVYTMAEGDSSLPVRLETGENLASQDAILRSGNRYSWSFNGALTQVDDASCI